jgi:hypothetical protein
MIDKDGFGEVRRFLRSERKNLSWGYMTEKNAFYSLPVKPLGRKKSQGER